MLDTSARLKKLRGSMSQEEIATSLGIHRNTWARWESGKGEPDLTVLGKIAQKMRISLEWLIMGTGQMHQEATPVSTPPPLCENEDVKASDSRRNEDEQNNQHIENNKEKTQTLFKISDTSENLRFRQKLEQSLEKILELQERLLKASEEKAELQVSLERAMMTIERRDMRIHELEKENAGLREAQKESAALQHDAEWRAG